MSAMQGVSNCNGEWNMNSRMLQSNFMCILTENDEGLENYWALHIAVKYMQISRNTQSRNLRM